MECLSVSTEGTAAPPSTPAPQGTAPSVQKQTCVWKARAHSGGDAGDPEIQSQ